MAETDKLNIDNIIGRLLEVRGARPGKNVQLTEAEIRGLCLKSREIFLSQPILLELEAPLKICVGIVEAGGKTNNKQTQDHPPRCEVTIACSFLRASFGNVIFTPFCITSSNWDVQCKHWSKLMSSVGYLRQTGLSDVGQGCSSDHLCRVQEGRWTLTLGAEDGSLTFAGDIHGQYYDLLRLFEYGGFPPESNYLFLGDYVDRGKQSLETICLLLAYKIKYPENFFLLRGNHECASINRIYGFYDECKRRYNIKLWKTFTDCFNCLPVAAIVDEKIFCCHGGLSPDLQSMEQIRRIMRPTDVPDQGLLCDLLWSDPDKDTMGWGENDRGVSFTFGAEVVVEDGYEFFAKRQLVTLFSAPNYCGEFDNAGAMMSVDETLMCSFQILKPADKRKFTYGGLNTGRPVTPPRGAPNKAKKK
ncbi:hypothetical protein B566_EDAN005564 [Ephemera danica]|nr:hypothetical protein B566_EDAN005564 [Ephemera danica]